MRWRVTLVLAVLVVAGPWVAAEPATADDEWPDDCEAEAVGFGNHTGSLAPDETDAVTVDLRGRGLGKGDFVTVAVTYESPAAPVLVTFGHPPNATVPTALTDTDGTELRPTRYHEERGLFTVDTVKNTLVTGPVLVDDGEVGYNPGDAGAFRAYLPAFVGNLCLVLETYRQDAVGEWAVTVSAGHVEPPLLAADADEERVRRLERRLEDGERRIARLEDRLAERNETVASYRRRLDEQNATVAALESRLATERARVRTLEARLENRTEEGGTRGGVPGFTPAAATVAVLAAVVLVRNRAA